MSTDDELDVAVAHQRACRLGEAEEIYRDIISREPGMAAAHFNLGTLLDGIGQWGAAISSFEKAVALRPDWAMAHWNLALALLRRGDFARGWREYEWRRQVPELGISRLSTSKPRWDGLPLDGRRILLYAEQGLGDSIQFARYLPRVADRGGQIMLAIQPELASLFSSHPAVQTCFTLPGHAPVAFDVHCALASLPLVFATTLTNIPSAAPYLSADPLKLEHWRDRFAGEKRRKIGIAWAGRPTHVNDHNRSIAAAILASLLAKLAALPDTRLISLQLSSGVQEPSLTDWTCDLRDFSDTAALVANLDMVISVDSSVAHLAGAMGKPVCLMLPFSADWRWLTGRTDSPWYASMRLFRQSEPGDWTGVFDEVAAWAGRLC